MSDLGGRPKGLDMKQRRKDNQNNGESKPPGIPLQQWEGKPIGSLAGCCWSNNMENKNKYKIEELKVSVKNINCVILD